MIGHNTFREQRPRPNQARHLRQLLDRTSITARAEAKRVEEGQSRWMYFCVAPSLIVRRSAHRTTGTPRKQPDAKT
eukprot:4824746-Pyramimonas_sp.AAC.1